MIENKYEPKIQEIFSRYCQPIHKNNYDVFLKRIEQVFQSHSHEPWAIFGAGEFSETVFKSIDFTKIQNFKGFFDNNQDRWGTEFLGGLIHNPATVVDIGVKKIFNFTFIYYLQAVEQFSQLDPHLKVLDFINELNFAFSDYQGYQLTGGHILFGWRQIPIPHLLDNAPFCISYIDLYIYRRLYETTKDPKEKKESLENLIASYIMMRDFLNAFLYIDRYVNDYGAGHYDLLKKELELLLEELTTALKKRECKDILLVLLDNLPAKKCYGQKEFSFLNQLAQEGTSYKKAYSPSLYTSESLSSIWRKTPAVQLLKEEGEIPFKDVMKKHGYTSAASASFNKKITSPNKSLNRHLYDENEIFQETDIKEMLSQQYWRAMTSIASEPEKHFFQIHAINETHHPFCCGAFKTEEDMYPPITTVIPNTVIQEFFEKRRSDVYSYVDEQSEFYLSMLSEKSVKVIFSDHGRHLDSYYTRHDPLRTVHFFSEHYQVPLILHGADIPQKEIHSIFSTMYLSDQLEGLMDDTVTVPKQHFAQVGHLSIREPNLRKLWISKGYQYDVDGFNLFLDEEYKMVRNAHGECRYFAMENETEEIHDPEIIAVIEKRFAHLFYDEEYFGIM